jgi:type II secretory pathway component PulF
MVFRDPNMTSWYEIFHFANEVTDNAFGIFIILGVFIITFLALKNHPAEKAFASSTFITAVIGIILRLMNIIDAYVMFICIIGAGISIVWLLRKES